MQSFKLAIFDLDGTLLDTNKVYCAAWIEAGQELGYPITQELYLEFLGQPSAKAKERLQQEFGENFPFEKALELRIQKATQALKDVAPVKAGVNEILEWFNKLGTPCAVGTTSQTEFTQSVLKTSNLLRYFTLVIGGDLVKKHKPNPEIYLEISKRLNVQPEDSIVFEDSRSGVEAAWRAEMSCVLIPDIQIPDQQALFRASVCCSDMHKALEFLKAPPRLV